MAQDKKKKPIRNGANGRFVKGNPGGPGNPYAIYTAKLRTALYAAINEKDIAAIALKQVEKAKNGNTYAAQFIYDRIFGKPRQPITDEDGGPVTINIKVSKYGSKS